MRLKTTKNKYGQIYIPAKVRETIGLRKMNPNPDKEDEELEQELEYIANRKTILLLPENMTAEEAIESVKTILLDLEHENKEDKKEEKNCA